MLRLLNPTDYLVWIEIAQEVEPLFGPMTNSTEFQNGIKYCIEHKNAYGIENNDGLLVGIIALDRDNNEILWLAVGKKFRGNSYGDQLVKKAIKELENNGDIFVQTFAKEVEEGKSARILYEKYEFADLKNAGKNPAGIETVIMVKKNK